MPDFVDNCAGYSAVTGTADYLMSTTGTGLHLRPDQALTDAQEVAYYAIGTSNGVDAFESGVATWDDSENTLVVGTITNSSNGGGKISWDAGDKTIYIVSSADMLTDMELMTEGATKKILTPAERAAIAAVVSADELDAAAQLDGTEIIPGLQSGSGVGITAQQIAGNPLTALRGLNLDRSRHYSNFSNTPIAFDSATSGTMFGAEPYEIYTSGTTGAKVQQGIGLFALPMCLLWTGTTTTGYAAIRNGANLYAFDPTKEATETSTVVFGLVLPATEAYACQWGFINNTAGPVVAPLQGIYFKYDAASGNIFGCVRSNVAESSVDTGVTVVMYSSYVCTWVYDPINLKTLFYVNDNAPVEILNSTRVVQTTQLLAPVHRIHKSAGTTSPVLAVQHHAYNLQTARLENYS